MAEPKTIVFDHIDGEVRQHDQGSATSAELSRLRAARDHWKNVSRRLLADLDGIRRNIEHFEEGLTGEHPTTTLLPDEAQLIGWCRVICEIALQDHAGQVVPRVDPPEPSSASDASEADRAD